MGIELEKKVINGITYECTQFPCRKSIKILSELAKIVGGPLAMMMGADDLKSIKDGNFSAKNERLLTDAVQLLIKDLDDDRIFSIILSILEGVIATESKELGLAGGTLKDQTSVDMHFKGGKGLARLFKVIVFALQTNYQDFLAEITEMVGQVLSE